MNITILLLFILTFISRVLGLGREMVLAYFYGASATSDAFLTSIAIPTIIVTFVVVALATSFVPIYINLDGNSQKQQRFLNHTVSLTLIISAFILIISFIFMPVIMPLFVSGFDEETMALTVSLTRISIFAVFFMAINHLLHSFLQAKEKVLLASLSGIPMNIVYVVFIAIGYYSGLYMLGLGTVVAMGAQTLYLLILAVRQGFRLKLQFSYKNDAIKKLLILSMPIIIANTVEQIGVMVDRNLASTFGPGAVSAMTYASRTVTALSGIFITSVVIVTFPKVAKAAAAKEMKQMKDLLAQSIIGLSLFIFPVVAVVALFTRPIIELLFGRGAFDYNAITITSSLLFFFIFFLIGNGFSQLFTRVFIAIEDSKTPMFVAAGTIILGIILNVVFMQWMDIFGLALATSLSAFIGMVVLIYLLRRKIGSLRLNYAMKTLNKIAGASVAMAFGAYFIYHPIAMLHPIAGLVIAAAVGIVLYGILLLVLGVREVYQIISFAVEKIKGFIKRKQG